MHEGEKPIEEILAELNAHVGKSLLDRNPSGLRVLDFLNQMIAIARQTNDEKLGTYCVTLIQSTFVRNEILDHKYGKKADVLFPSKADLQRMAKAICDTRLTDWIQAVVTQEGIADKGQDHRIQNAVRRIGLFVEPEPTEADIQFLTAMLKSSSFGDFMTRYRGRMPSIKKKSFDMLKAALKFGKIELGIE